MHLDYAVERLHRLSASSSETQETMTQFYLTLPSNSSQQFFPDNTLTEFTTKLPSTIELTGEWEVGLAEIMFPRSWYTIPKDGQTIIADYRECDGSWKLETSWKFLNGVDVPEEDLDNMVDIKLCGGFYNTMLVLIQELIQAMVRSFSSLR